MKLVFENQKLTNLLEICVFSLFLKDYEFNFDSPTVLVIGNEGRGLSKQMQELATNVVSIPRYGGAESLNAAMASGIIVAEVRRKTTIGKQS